MERPHAANQVARLLLRRLSSGVWRHPQAIPGSLVLAADFGVSQVTMLGALRQLAGQGLLDIRPRRPVTVCKGASERAADLLRFRTMSPSARRVAVLVPAHLLPFPQGDYYQTITALIDREARRRGFECYIVSWPQQTQIPFLQQHVLRHFGAAVAICVTTEYLPSLHFLSEQQAPVLLLNRWLPWLNSPNLGRDDYEAAKRIGRLLLENGHRNVCLVVAQMTDGLNGPRGRVHGWLDFLQESHLAETSDPGILAMPPLGLSCSFVRHLLAADDGPTALVFAHAYLAKRFFEEPALATVRVPGRISVATFDSSDTIPTTPRRPALTSITLDSRRAAECVIEIIERLLRGERDHLSIRLSLDINVTASIGPPPEADMSD